MRATRGRGVVTPDLAQQAGVLPYCQRQHDRKESCSKHVMLAIPKGKCCASQKERESQKTLTFSPTRHRWTEGTCGISPVGAENSPTWIGTLSATATSRWTWLSSRDLDRGLSSVCGLFMPE